MPLWSSKFYTFSSCLQTSIEKFTSLLPNIRCWLPSIYFWLKSYPWRGSIDQSVPCHLSDGNEEVTLQMLSRPWNLALLLFWPFRYCLFGLTGHCQSLLQVGCVLRTKRAEFPAKQQTSYWKGQNQLVLFMASTELLSMYTSWLTQKLAHLRSPFKVEWIKKKWKHN